MAGGEARGVPDERRQLPRGWAAGPPSRTTRQVSGTRSEVNRVGILVGNDMSDDNARSASDSFFEGTLPFPFPFFVPMPFGGFDLVPAFSPAY